MLYPQEVYNLGLETQMRDLVSKTIIIIANIYHVFTSERNCSKCFSCMMSFYSENCLTGQILVSSPATQEDT